MNNVFISCKESRIENNRSFYGCFNISAFDPVQSLTVANALRRTLLSECPGLGIISVTIENVSHEYSTLPGMRESVLDLLLNLKEIVFRSNIDNIPSIFAEKLNVEELASLTKKTELLTSNDFLSFFMTKKRNPKKPLVGYLKVKGPGVIRARDLKLPPFIQCVDPNQYIATLAEDGYLSMKFILMEGKGYLIQKNNSFINNSLLKKRANFLNDIKKTQDFNVDSKLRIDSNSYNEKLDSNPSKRNSELETSMISTLNTKARFQKEKTVGSMPSYPFRGGAGKDAKAGRSRFDSHKVGGNTNKPLNLDCVFNPVTKVSYIIEDFDNKVTNDFNNNLSFINDISSLIESSSYLKKHIISPPASLTRTGVLKKNPFPKRLGQEARFENSTSTASNESLAYFVETFTKNEINELSSYLHPLQKQNSLHNIVLEIWTNGSLHPREALAIGFQNLGSLFLNLNKTNVF